MNYQLILQIVDSFYKKANHDILIGYHFRIIENFDEHIPRIADFWNLQLNGVLENKANLPFELIKIHKALKLNRGEVDRWQRLFKMTLDSFVESEQITSEDRNLWMAKVELFKDRIQKEIFTQPS